MNRLTIKAPSGLIHLKDNTEMTVNVAIKKLSNFEDLEEQNRLIKLPCAVGDKVFIIVGKDISKQTVKKIIIREDSVIIETNKRIFNKICFGKTVFLTREEAEAALKELESGKGE